MNEYGQKLQALKRERLVSVKKDDWLNGQTRSNVSEAGPLLPPTHGATPKMQPLNDDDAEEELRRQAVDALPSTPEEESNQFTQNGRINKKYLAPNQSIDGRTQYATATAGDSTKPSGVIGESTPYSPMQEATNQYSQGVVNLHQQRDSDYMHSVPPDSRLQGLFSLSDNSLRVQDSFVCKSLLSSRCHFMWCVVHSQILSCDRAGNWMDALNHDHRKGVFRYGTMCQEIVPVPSELVASKFERAGTMLRGLWSFTTQLSKVPTGTGISRSI
jgi:hypothetical protein